MKRYGTTTVSATISHKQRAFLSNRCRHLHWLIVYTLASIFFCLPAVADKPEPIAKGPELKVTLSALEPGNSHVLFTMTNISDKPVSILRWTTPFSSTLEGDMFVVTRQGKNQRRVGYSGRLVKRGGPTNDDYFVLQPGESLSREIDVLFGYAARIAGKYTIQFQYFVAYLGEESQAKTPKIVGLSSNVVSVIQPFDREPTLAKLSKAIGNTCDTTQQGAIEMALSEAKIISENALNALTSTAEQNRPYASRYNTWFGNYSSTRYTLVTNNFTRIRDALNDRPIEFVCNPNDCEPGLLAFVFPYQHYTVNLCPLFFEISLSGVDSQSGTIVHEMSHFGVVAGTEDLVYGTSPSKDLAFLQTDLAIHNADNYAYFAENPDGLDMEDGGSSIEALTPDAAVSGSVSAGDCAFYRVSGATRVELYDLTADIDLYLLQGSYFCESVEEGIQEEVCDVGPSGTTYIEVCSYQEAGSYSLIARGIRDPILDIGMEKSGFLQQGAWAFYRASGATAIQLNVLDGDQDLYIAIEGRPDQNNFICRPYLAGTLAEICSVSPEDTVYIGIYAEIAGNYTINPAGPGPLHVTGSVFDEEKICAMVLVSGQYTFTCGHNGLAFGDYSLENLPIETDGTIKLQVYADGFKPYTMTLNGSSSRAIKMQQSGNCPDYNSVRAPLADPGRAGDKLDISGNILIANTSDPVCAMVLANGQYDFSCGGDGAFDFNVPLDANGQVKMQVYADGWVPYTFVFDSSSPVHTVRLARATECN